MGTHSGPRIITDGLILNLQPGSIKNAKLSSTNLFTNGAFAGGTGIPEEGDSNPTNTIIEMKNPGDSNYVLQQNGNYTEYQINLTTELAANTTYVMSGWYTKSSDYNGADTMFHARAHSLSGAHNATGTDLGIVLYTVNIDGVQWKYCYQTITTPADYSTFSWFVGWGQPSHNGYRYYTNIKLERGTFPSLVDFSGYNNHHAYVGTVNYANNQFTLNGTDAGFHRNSALNGVTNNCTVVMWYSTTDTQELWVRGNQNGGVYLSASVNNNYYHGGCGSPINYVDTATVVNPATPTNYRNGNYHMWEAKGVDFSGWNYYEWFLYPGGWQMAGNVSNVLVYNRQLTSAESAQNFQALRSRFGI